MNLHTHLFSDYFSYQKNLLTTIDPRIKTVFTVLMIFTVILLKELFILLFISVSIIILLLLNRIPARILIVRISAPLVISAVLISIQAVFNGTHPFTSFCIGGFVINIYREGLSYGIIIGTRILCASSLVLFLSMTTPLNYILETFKYFKIPQSIIEVGLYTYRYVFVFLESSITIMSAQKTRLGYKNLNQGIKSFGVLIGSMIINAFEQAEKTHDSMILRGYSGNLVYYTDIRNFDRIDFWIGGFMFFLWIVLVIISLLRGWF